MEENMRALTAHTISCISRSVPAAMIGAWVAIGAPASASANVITDWDEKAVAATAPMISLPAARHMGLQIGEYVVKNVMQPVVTATP